MWLPEWVNIEEGARQLTPLEGGENAVEKADAGSLFCLLSVGYSLPPYTSTADNKSYKQEGSGRRGLRITRFTFYKMTRRKKW